MCHRRSHQPSRPRPWQLPGAKIHLKKMTIFLIVDVAVDVAVAEEDVEEEDVEDVAVAAGVAVAVGP